MENSEKKLPRTENGNELADLKIKISPELYRAFQRCTWVIVNETGRGQLEIMDEMVRDFLVKHGC
ncbi:MAG: hypothetical protein KKG47_05260 [Proteobacteria bacterium]|nr:hypothetical protein [Pseudomonadota bacterium]MBU1736885.1 hypothetical protein [Pseudomonadota bacterium]